MVEYWVEFVFGIGFVSEYIVVIVYLYQVLVDVYGIVWFVFYWFGQECGVDFVVYCCFVYGVFEQEYLVSQVYCIGMGEIDFQLCCVGFVDQCVYIQFYCIGVVVYQVEDWVEFVDCVD